MFQGPFKEWRLKITNISLSFLFYVKFDWVAWKITSRRAGRTTSTLSSTSVRFTIHFRYLESWLRELRLRAFGISPGLVGFEFRTPPLTSQTALATTELNLIPSSISYFIVRNSGIHLGILQEFMSWPPKRTPRYDTNRIPVLAMSFNSVLLIQLMPEDALGKTCDEESPSRFSKRRELQKLKIERARERYPNGSSGNPVTHST